MTLGSITGRLGLHVQSHAMQDIHIEQDIATIQRIVLVIEMNSRFVTHNLAKCMVSLLFGAVGQRVVKVVALE